MQALPKIVKLPERGPDMDVQGVGSPSSFHALIAFANRRVIGRLQRVCMATFISDRRAAGQALT